MFSAPQSIGSINKQKFKGCSHVCDPVLTLQKLLKKQLQDSSAQIKVISNYSYSQPITNASTQKTSITNSVKETSFLLPAASLMIVQLKNPQMIPCVIE